MNIAKRTTSVAVTQDALKLARLAVKYEIYTDAKAEFSRLLGELVPDYTHGEIAELLGISRPAVTQMLQQRGMVKTGRARAARQQETATTQDGNAA